VWQSVFYLFRISSSSSIGDARLLNGSMEDWGVWTCWKADCMDWGRVELYFSGYGWLILRSGLTLFDLKSMSILYSFLES
jgi:hypothetical protein